MVTVSTIANATQGELLCITYEMFLYNIEEALKTSGESRDEYIMRALDIIRTLAGDLNFEMVIAQDLFKLYIYVQGILITRNVTDEKLEHAYKIIDVIYKGFLQICDKTLEASPSMKNAEAIYAGMTYSKSDLNEMVIRDNNRGFRA
jgi:flagellar protein FliS